MNIVNIDLQKRGNRWYAVVGLSADSNGRRRCKWIPLGADQPSGAERGLLRLHVALRGDQLSCVGVDTK